MRDDFGEKPEKPPLLPMCYPEAFCEATNNVKLLLYMVPVERIELPTFGLQISGSDFS